MEVAERGPRSERMRFMLDTMIFDHIVDDPAFANVVRDAAHKGSITIVSTHIQEDQIAAIPDDEKRKAISRIPRTVVATTGLAWGVSRLGMAAFADDDTSATIERMGQRHLKNTMDALMAASARDEADVFVTEDKTLRHRIRRDGMNVPVLTFAEFRRQVSSLSPEAESPDRFWAASIVRRGRSTG